MEEQACPRCKTTKYRNPSLVLMVNTCGHALCESCVELLFVKGSGSCPECQTALRRAAFRVQLFEDPSIDKEVDVRRKVLRDYNKRREDFATARDYDDYLEEVEEIIHNLVTGFDLHETMRRVEQYKRDNKDLIKKNANRRSREDAELDELLEQEKAMQQGLNGRRAMELIEDKKKKLKAKEKLIDELMFSDVDAASIVEQHAKSIAAAAAARDEAAAAGSAAAAASVTGSAASGAAAPPESAWRFSSGVRIGGAGASRDFLPLPVQVETAPYCYVRPVLSYDGPTPPTDSTLQRLGYCANIRAADAAERAAGYTEALSCLRALQEAMCGLFYVPSSSRSPLQEAPVASS